MALTLLLGFAAVNTGNNLLFLMVAAMLGFMAVSGIIGWSNIRGLHVIVDAPDEIYSGHDTLLTLRLSNRKKVMPSFLLRITIQGQSCDFPYIGCGATAKDSMVISFPHRGRHIIERAQVFSPFPVNFFVRSNSLPCHKSCVVFPSPAFTPAIRSATADVQGEFGFFNKGYEGDVNRIKDYAGGDPLKMIHWRLSAKHDQIKVKEMSDQVGEPVIIDLHQLPGNIEKRLSSAAFLINRMIRSNRPVGLKVGDIVTPVKASNSHRLKLLTELALYDQH